MNKKKYRDELDELVDNDELSPDEEGFMIGYEDED